VARLRPTSLSDRILRLEQQAEEVRRELEKLQKEEEYLREQTEKAEGQLTYYEALLKDLRKRSVNRESMRKVVGRF
jgi:predicted  nucleic acid-binding Zn-ribbon protein